jgi:PKD repeat protein
MRFNIVPFLLVLVSFGGWVRAQNVGIGTQNPHPSARLDVSANNAGLLIPRLSASEMQAIVNPANGLQIYNTTNQCLMMYFPQTGWKSVTCDCAQFPNPQFTTTPTVLTVGQPIQFTPSHAGGQYQWQFSGGNPATSTSATPTVVFSNPGPITARLRVTDVFGCADSSLQTLQVLNCVPGALNAAFTFSPTTVSVGSTVTFTPTMGSSVNHQWSFASGATSTSTLVTPTTFWSATGSFTVIHTITDPANGCTDADTVQITVVNCPSGSQTFTFSGGAQTFQVPACVSSITVEAFGAQGGAPGGNSVSGRGARVQATLQVVGGSTLQVNVGGQGALSAGGWNGGGNGNSVASSSYRGWGGGGASDIRSGGTALANRILVAGGGGGYGTNHTSNASNFYGGAGGQNGAVGTCGDCTGGCTPAGGGTQSAGGTAASGPNLQGTPGPGSLGQGGNAGATSSGYFGGGGGGGGYYGGGASIGCGSNTSGGGAGGSSWVNPTGSSGVTISADQRSGNGQIVISW